MTKSFEQDQHLKTADTQHHFHPKTNPTQLAKDGPSLIKRAEGIYIYTDDNRKIIDAMSGLNCVNIGYSNKRLCDAAYQAMSQLSFAHTFGGHTNPWVAALSEKLTEITPDSYQRFFFSTTGSDAVETSLKIAFHYWQLRGRPSKKSILSLRHAYHGNTLVAASLTGIDGYHKQFDLPLPGIVHHVDSPYLYRYGRGQTQEAFGLEAAAALEHKIKELGPENIAAFIGEPVQVTGGMVIPPETYWPEVQRLCEKYEILLIADEVGTGFGKTGHLFGCQAMGFEPDLIVMAKGLSSGYFPIAAVGIHQKIDEVLQSDDNYFLHGFTNCGHPVGAAVALENIAVIEEQGLIGSVESETGPYLKKRLQGLLAHACVAEVRCLGLLAAIEIDGGEGEGGSLDDNVTLAAKIADAAFAKGLIARPLGASLGLMLPLITTKDQIDEVVDILEASITETL